MAATHALPRSPRPRNPLQGGSPRLTELAASPSLGGTEGRKALSWGTGQGRCLAGAGMEVPCAGACTDPGEERVTGES